jgi:hypothetical protein
MVTGPTIATAGIGWTAIGNASNFGRINSSPPLMPSFHTEAFCFLDSGAIGVR